MAEGEKSGTMKNELHYSLGSGEGAFGSELVVELNVNFIVKHPVPANFRALSANDNAFATIDHRESSTETVAGNIFAPG